MIEINPDVERLIAVLADRAVATEALTEADWDRLIALARLHTVAPVLYLRLKKRGITPPPAMAEQLRRIYLASAVRNTELFHELGHILRALQAAHIPVIPLKGACLAEAVYGNIALRSMGDVDLLVKSNDLAQALDVLRALGYVSEYPFEIETERRIVHHMPRISKPGGLIVEMHWTIVHPRNVCFGDNDLDPIWSRAHPVKIAGVQVLMLSPTDLLLHQCLHPVQHRFNSAGLRNYVDIALVIQRYGEAIDWEQFTARAKQWDIANGVRLALQLAEEWTGAAVPAGVLAALTTAPLDDAVLDWVRHKVLNGSSLALTRDAELFKGKVRMVALFEGKARWRDKLGLVRDELFPSRVLMARQYPAPANSWRILGYYAIHFKDLWVSQSRAIWQLVWRDKTFATRASAGAGTPEARQEECLHDYLGRH